MMGVKKLVAFIAIAGLIFGDAFAQSRGSSRYVPPNEYADDNTPAPRLSRTRSSQASRQPKQTQPTESWAEKDDIQEYQPPELPPRSGTTGRRVPLRNAPQDFPDPALSSTNDRNPVITTEIEELPSLTTSAPSRRPPVRRRRPKKRKRPQGASETEPVPNSGTPEAPISELLNTDEKRPFSVHGETSPRAYPTFNPHLRSQTHDELLGINKNTRTHSRVNEAEPQYFRPEASRNRLPTEDTEAGKVLRNPHYQDAPGTRYTSTTPDVSQQNRDTYVPVLAPIRTPTRDIVRPHDYSEDPTESENPEILSNKKNYPSSQSTRSPNRYNPNTDETPHPAPKPSANIISEVDEVIHPGRIHSNSEPHREKQPQFTDDYNPAGAQPDDETFSRPRPTEDTYNDAEEELPKTTNRLPNSSEVHYDSVYPSYEEDMERVTRAQTDTEPPTTFRVRQTTSAKPHRNAVQSYSNVRNLESTKPHDYDNDAETNAQQPPRYQPPLQRGSSRYAPESPVGSSRSGPAYQDQEAPLDVPRRARGPSRHQNTAEAPVRTRGSTRYQPDTIDSLPKTRPSLPPRAQQTPDRSRGVSNYQRDPVESGSRLSSRRQPETHSGNEYPQPNFQNINRVIQSGTKPARQSVHSSRSQPNWAYQEGLGGIEGTLRSRPQYVAKAVEEDYSIKEENNDFIPPEELPPSNVQTTRHRTEHQTPSQPNRAPVQEQSVQRQPAQRGQQNNGYPQYQAPQNPRHAEPEIRDYPQYEEPQNPRPLRRDHETRDYPQYQEPQNPRRPPPQSSRSPSRPRHQEPEPQTKPRGRPSGGSGFTCPDSFGFFADPRQCDKYYECRNGTAEVHLCNDGLAFNEVSAPKYLRCDSLRDVDCSSRPQLQEPQSSPNCPRKFGLFPHETECTKFFNCVDGAATEVQCPPGLTYNDDRATCDWADLVKSSCKTEDLLGFSCPEPTDFDLQDGVYTRYPHPDNCQLHFTCIKGEDGLRRPRMLSCNEGQVFNPATGFCARPDDVPGCEEFYGPRSPPKRKPARQPAPTPREPEPEPEEYEETTSRPRRRGHNRRTRN